MKIASEYQGKDHIALTRLEKMYDLLAGPSEDQLAANLLGNQKVLGKRDYEVKIVYKNVELELVTPVLKEATKRLEAGEQVDLENLLAQPSQPQIL